MRTTEIQSTFDQTYLAWYGPATHGSPASFRIIGPTLVIEYAPQQIGGSAANHIHGMDQDSANADAAVVIESAGLPDESRRC